MKENRHDRFTDIVYISDKLKDWYKDTYVRLTKLFEEMDIEWAEIPYTKDIWVRDFMPVQIEQNDFLLYRYYPDYCDNNKERKYITDAHKCCDALGIKYREVSTLLDGGNMVACGNKFVLTSKIEQTNTQSSLQELREALRDDIIVIPWHKISDDDPFGHSDGFIHWCGGNEVLMNNHRDTDPIEAAAIKRIMENNGFIVTEILFDGISELNSDFNWAYVNYLQLGEKIIMPSFGIAEDRIALDYVQKANPGCEVRQIRLRDIASEGGALHCMTWNIRKPIQ